MLVVDKVPICYSCEAVAREHFILQRAGREKRDKCGICGKAKYCIPYAVLANPKPNT